MPRRGYDTWTVWTLDVWGNEEDGFEVNDRSPVGRIDLPDDATDRAIVRLLANGLFLGKTVTERDVEVDSSDPDFISIDTASNLEPLLQLTRGR